MSCYSPIQAWRGKPNKNGKYPLVFKREFAFLEYPGDLELKVPCNQCVGCRLEYSRQWAIRCMHEADMHTENSFITLTYNDKFLPLHSSLDYLHWTKFMKRLRFKFKDVRIRFFMGAEYGTLSKRPHYHALLFGLDFPDKELFSIRNDYRLYVSKILDKLWSCPKTGESYGFASVGSCTFESAAYVARYMLKKVKGDDLTLRYFSDVDFETGEVFKLQPEKARMSNRPGIAKDWFDKFYSDIYDLSKDFVVMNGKKVRPPRYYDKLYESFSPEVFEAIKAQRVLDSEKYESNNTPERLGVRLKVKLAQLSRLVRNLE